MIGVDTELGYLEFNWEWLWTDTDIYISLKPSQLCLQEL